MDGYSGLRRPPGVDHAPDQVKRLAAFRAAHPNVTVMLSGPRPAANWTEVSADPRIDGTAVTVERDELRDLLDYLEVRFGRLP